MANKYIREGATYNGDGTSSAAASGSTVTITIASPGVVTWTSHGLANDTPVYLGTTGALPTGLTAGTKYYVRNAAANTFELSATAGGASINTSGTQSGTHTATTAGSWNHINIVSGTAVNQLTGKTEGGGSIAAGDIVYIRSKDNGGANITVTASGNVTLGSASATATSPIRWVLDNGVIWSGIDGTVTYSHGSAYTITLRDFNEFHCMTKDALIFYVSNNSWGSSPFLYMSQATLRNALIDMSFATLSFGPRIVMGAGGTGGRRTMESCHIKSATRYQYLFESDAYGLANLIDIDIELTTSNTTPLFQTPNYGGIIRVVGGQVRGSGSTTTGLTLCAGGGGSGCVRLLGLNYPNTIGVFSSDPPYYPNWLESVSADGVAGTVAGGIFGTLDSRNDGNYPTLNAVLPDSANTAWSYKLYAKDRFIHDLSFLYTSAAAAKTLTLYLLQTTSWVGAIAPNGGTFWITVSYVDDATGLVKSVSSFAHDNAALASSTAAWSATSYGAISLTKKEIAVTTPTSIKQNTMVTITLHTNVVSNGPTSDLIFFCPAVQAT